MTTTKAKKEPHTIVETPKQLADRIGLPVSNVRYLIKSKKLDHVFASPGKRNPKVPDGAWEKYLTEHAIR